MPSQFRLQLQEMEVNKLQKTALRERSLFRILASCGINFPDSESSESTQANAITWELHILKTSPSAKKH